MRFSRFIKNNLIELVFTGMVVICFVVYFVIYMTPNRVAWYKEMRNQLIIYFEELTNIGQ